MGRRRTTIALSALLALGLASCGGDAGEGNDASPSPPASGATAPTTPDNSGGSASPVVADVLDFEAPLLSGGTLDGETLAGRDVAFWFWAPW